MQSFRLEFSATQGGCYDFLVREKDRCEEFLSLFTGKLSQFNLIIFDQYSLVFFSALQRLIEVKMPSLHCHDFHSFCFTHADVVQQAQSKAGTRPVVVTPPHPQTLQHIR